MESNSDQPDPDPEVNQENTDEETLNEEGFDEIFEEKGGHGKRAKTSLSWEYFDIKDSKLRLAICKLCSCEMSYRSSVSNLMKHVRRKHNVAFNSCKIDEGKPDVNKESTDDESHNEEGFDEFFEEKVRKRANSSFAWHFFDVKDSKRRLAICKLCSCEMSYWSSVSNLTKHVKRKHVFALNAYKLEGSRSAPDRQHAQRDKDFSSVWNYYKRFDNIEKIAECLVCKKQLSYNFVSNLRKHLRRQHPNLKVEDNKQVIVDSDGQLYEIEQTKSENIQNGDDEQPLDIDSVFIDDFDGDVIERKRKNKVLERNGKRKKVFIQDTDENDSTDEITFQKRYVRKKNDSLDQFGRYLISIMRQLPKELSNQLQVDFVKQVMTTQLTYETQQKATVQKNDYAITITDNGSHNTDHQYVIEEHVVESVET